MAGDLFIMSIDAGDIVNLQNAGARLMTDVHHANRTAASDYVTLEARLGGPARGGEESSGSRDLGYR